MKKERPETTLFMLCSVDGKISTGAKDERDVDKDFPKIRGLKEGLKQYYDLEKKTDMFSMNTGKVMAKIGMNGKKEIKKIPVCFVIVDNKPHLTSQGVRNLIEKGKKLYLVTTNANHPAFEIESGGLKILFYKNKIDFDDLFKILRKKYGARRLTVQCGGMMNSFLLRKGLIDQVSLVVAPAIIGGKETPSLADGDSLAFERDLGKIAILKLRSCRVLKNSYLHLRYDVVN